MAAVDELGDDPAAMRATLGDGTFGGSYERPDEEMLRLWEVAVAEVRELIESGWSASAGGSGASSSPGGEAAGASVMIAIGISRVSQRASSRVAERLGGADHARLADIRRVRVAREQVREAAVEQLVRRRRVTSGRCGRRATPP